VIVNGVWVLGFGDSSPEIRKIKAYMRKMFALYAGSLADTELYDQQMVVAVTEMQRRYGIAPSAFTGTIGYSLKVKMGYLKLAPAPPSRVLFTVNGAAVDMWTGYQADIGRVLASANLYYWQPVGYDSKPFPMSAGLKGGTTELVRQIRDVHPAGPFAICAYSEGAIISSNVYDMLRDPSSPIGHRRKDFLGAATFGNPRRQKGHSIPGGMDPGGEGIVSPTLANTEDFWWDLANGKHMPGAVGDDLYTTMSGATGEEARVMRTIWGFVYNVWDGVSDLATDLFHLLGNPLGLSVGAVKALVAAITFFGAEHLAPHTDYQFSHPIPNDPRDSWRIALDHIASLAA
jgi:hypothetical protein